MGEVKFKKDYLVNELGLPFDSDHVQNDVIIDNTRWSIVHEIVFEVDGKFYSTYYEEGATECQYEEPWESEDEIECTEVELVPVVKHEWVPVGESEYDDELED